LSGRIRGAAVQILRHDVPRGRHRNRHAVECGLKVVPNAAIALTLTGKLSSIPVQDAASH
jgi:hypothetical protein